MKKLVLIFSCMFTFGFSLLPVVAEAGNFQPPNYAQGQDVKQAVQSKGKDLTDLFGMIAAIVCILGIIVGAIKMGGGNAEGGKSTVMWSVIGLIIVGMAYGIAILAMK